jgi:hypothetical protein
VCCAKRYNSFLRKTQNAIELCLLRIIQMSTRMRLRDFEVAKDGKTHMPDKDIVEEYFDRNGFIFS